MTELNEGDRFEQDKDSLYDALETMLTYWKPVEVAAEVMTYLAEREQQQEAKDTPF